jgi:hypothetical protein
MFPRNNDRLIRPVRETDISDAASRSNFAGIASIPLDLHTLIDLIWHNIDEGSTGVKLNAFTDLVC